MNSKLKPASSRFKATSTRSKRIPSASRSEEHTSELQSLTNLVCRLLLEKKEHTSELQSLTNLVCRLLLEKKRKELVTDVNAQNHVTSASFCMTEIYVTEIIMENMNNGA